MHKIYESIQDYTFKGVDKNKSNLSIFETEHE